RGRLAMPGGKNWSVTYRGDFGYNTLTVGEEAARNFELLNNELFRKGAIIKNSVSVTGGTDQMRMYLSVDRDGEDGHVPENRFEQTNVRANFDFFPSQKFTLRASTQFSDAEIEWPIHGNRERSGGEWRYLIFNRFGYNDPRSRSIKPNYWATNSDLNFINSFTGSVTAELSPWQGSGSRLEGLSARVTLGMDNRDNRNIQIQEVTTLELHGQDEDGEKRIAQRNSRVLTYTGDVAYKYNLGPFSATSTVGTQVFNERARSVVTEKFLFANALLSDISVGEEVGEILEENDHTRSAGVFTSHDISYRETYYATLMLRRDFASVLGPLTSAITYPAVKFMVRLDQFDWTPGFFSFLKLRTAYGETGVLPGRTDGIPLLWRAAESQFGIGGTISSIGNPRLKPERVKEFEIGFEAEVANYALDFTYYRQNTSDSIIPAENVPSSGLTSDEPKLNIGKIEGSGWEAQLHANFAGRKFGGWRTNFTLTQSWQTNEVTDMGGANEIRQGPGGGRQYYREGLPKGAFYNPITIGAIFATEGNRISNLEFDPRRGTEVPVGTIIGYLESDGPVNLGTGDPDYYGSFASNLTVGGFTFYSNLSWKTGFFLYNEDRVDRISRGLRIPDGAYFTGDGGNVLDFDIMVQQLGIGDTGTGVATLTPGTQEYIDVANRLASTNRRNDANSIQPGDFLKLRELSFSYSFDKLLRKSSVFSNITGLRVGIVGTNLKSWFKRDAYIDKVTQEDGSVVEHWVGGFTGADSEANSFGFTDGPQNSFNNGTIPQGRSWSAFVTLTF
ncbi:MAG: TonB-dependent receptor, partial [Verrucomicrobia bacterium]|nr:TonB-dependent receptor [Verrucomicrobiota bacterium]